MNAKNQCGRYNKKYFFFSILTLLSLLLSPSSLARPSPFLSVAVATNFIQTFGELQSHFEMETGYELRPSYGSTGQLYHQIRNGAPYKIFLSADEERVRQLILENRADKTSAFIYARGRLALWSQDLAVDLTEGKRLHANIRQESDRLAIANPKVAPYGRAAIESLNTLGLSDFWQSRLIKGQNIAQTHQFVFTGNVTMGFVSLAQIRTLEKKYETNYWLAPEKLHLPINQMAVLLTPSGKKASQDDSHAIAFLNFLQSPLAKTIIKDAGYSTP